MAKEFKSPSAMAMYADKLWDALRAQTSDSFVAAASSSCCLHLQAHPSCCLPLRQVP